MCRIHHAKCLAQAGIKIARRNVNNLRYADVILEGSKISSDCDCRHEIKRSLLLERKAMISLDIMLKSRDITLPTKVHLVKAKVFPVVMYGGGRWTIKTAECQL